MTIPLKVWNIATGKEIVCFVGPHSAVISCNFSPDGKHVISGSRDKTIKYWSLEPALETLNHGAHHSQIDLCQFTPLGSLILTRDKDNAIKLYDPETGSLITDIINDGGDFTHKGKNFKYKSWNCSGGQKIIKIWDIKTNETLFTLPSDFFAFSPDYKNFVAGHEEVHGSADEYNIKIHKTDSNENDYVTWRSDSFITSYSYSPDGKTIATSNDHRPLSIHDAITGKLIKSFQDLGKPVKCCSFSPDGQQIVTGNNERQIETMYDKLINAKKTST
jgi:WD40 repeat protein